MDEKKQKEASIGPYIKNDVHNEHRYHLTELNRFTTLQTGFIS